MFASYRQEQVSAVIDEPRATRCVTLLTLYQAVDAECDNKLASVVGRTIDNTCGSRRLLAALSLLWREKPKNWLS